MLLLICCQDWRSGTSLSWNSIFFDKLPLSQRGAVLADTGEHALHENTTVNFKNDQFEAEQHLHDLQTLNSKLICWQHFLSPAHWHFQEAIMSSWAGLTIEFGKGKTGPLLLVKNKIYLHKLSQSCECFGIFIAWRQLGDSLITQTAELEWMTDSRTPMVTWTVTHLS